jgi:hypothetical protein
VTRDAKGRFSLSYGRIRGSDRPSDPQGFNSSTERLEVNSGRTPPPNIYWTLVLEVGLLGWIGTVIWLILGYDLKKQTSRYLSKWGVLFLFFFAVWIVGMMKA